MDSSPQHIHSTFAHRTSTTHKYIGYTIGIMSLLVTAVVIYGVGGPLFPKKYYRHLSQEQRDKGFYENIAPHIPKFFFVITFGWLGAVYSDLIIVLVITFILWLIGLGGAAGCTYLYFNEGIDRHQPQVDTEYVYNKEREIYLIVGVAYWTFSLIIAGIWCATRRVEEPTAIHETELTPIK